MLHDGDCETCAWQVDGACDCAQSRYYRFACMFIRPPRCDCYSRRPAPLPAIGGGLEEPREEESDATA